MFFNPKLYERLIKKYNNNNASEMAEGLRQKNVIVSNVKMPTVTNADGTDIDLDARGRILLMLCMRSFSISQMSFIIYTIDDKNEKQTKPIIEIIIKCGFVKLKLKKRGTNMSMFFIQCDARIRRR
jgi:hypothetical protein